MANPIRQAPLDTLKFLHLDGEPFELCIIGPKSPKRNLWKGYASGKGIVAGWFRDHTKAVALAAQVQAEGVYVTLHPCQAALLSRANERLIAQVPRTQDKEISYIRNLLIDLDPNRPTGISSTDPEHEAALEMPRSSETTLRKKAGRNRLWGTRETAGTWFIPLTCLMERKARTW
jgi:hypothetical protein